MSYKDPINFDFSGKTAFVTGAASGIGRLTAERFAEMGAAVVLTDINQEGIDAVAAEIAAKGGRAIAVAADIRKFDEVLNVRKKTMEAFGRIDFLINCAGGASGRINHVKESFRDWPIEALDWGIDVNLKGPMYVTRACIGDMIDGGEGGVIIYLGSAVGSRGGNGGSADYSTAKAGLMFGMTKSMAQYGAPYNIRCNAVSPGPVLTREAMAKTPTLLGRAAEPIEVVNLITYLCSDQASFITGSNYAIDAGRACQHR